MVERAQLEDFRLANAELSRLVKRDLTSFFRSLNLSRPEAARDALLAFVPALTAQYGGMAASLAAEFYEESRAAAGARDAFTALSADPVPAGPVEAKIRYLAGHLWTPTPEMMLGGLLLAADKYVKQPGRDTVATNAKREGVRWARVPTGAKTCAFCLMLASRDATYHSKRSAGDLGRGVGDAFHGDCNCEVVRIGKEKDYPEGYLPDNYLQLYTDAINDDGPEVQEFLESLPEGTKHKQLKAAAFSLRRLHPDAVKDGVHTH